jgi:hypothetical protein
MERRRFVEGAALGTASLALTGARTAAPASERAFWTLTATRIARPVLATRAGQPRPGRAQEEAARAGRT